MTFKRVLAGSGLNKMELAELYGVSRQTIHTWARGDSPREGTYTERMQIVITAALVNAMARGILPLGAMDREARKERVRRMAVRCQSLKPAPISGK